MALYFTFFFISGLCSLVYELVWLRLAMAQFGVTTALTSIVLSMFMGGLGLGSVAAGRLTRAYGERFKRQALKVYGLAELLIGCSALAVPLQLSYGHHLLESLTSQTAWSSASYYLASGAWLALTLVPWCACMGATIPLAMFAIRTRPGQESSRSFSFLYLANVAGAIAGAVCAPLLIELGGFHATLRVGVVLNGVIAVGAIGLAMDSNAANRSQYVSDAKLLPSSYDPGRSTIHLLFLTGLTTMGMEVIWIRLFTPYAGPVVYAFATILAAYLLATFAGSRIYRNWSGGDAKGGALAWSALIPLGMLPLLTSDVRLGLAATLRIFIGVMPFAGVVGFLTPMLVDRWAGGDADRAGKAYGINVLGCIVGPLISGFLLLPVLGERWSVLVLTLPWLAITIRNIYASPSRGSIRVAFYSVAGAWMFLFFTRDFAAQYSPRRVLRDSTATVIATGEGLSRRLIINGVDMTTMVPVTKMMAHLSLASLIRPPQNALVICFGMGTTFRSAMSWGIATTAVDLIPSVPKLFAYYHADAEKVLASPRARVLVDDGRRFLERSPEQYDIIIIDPPPPVQAAGSSLLYSEEFYAVARKRLRPGGILQQWLPDEINDANDNQAKVAIIRALTNSFPYVRVFQWNGRQGWHFLASQQPIPMRSARELADRVPAAAAEDMLEWGPEKTADQQFARLLSRESKPEQMIALSPGTPGLRDDRPINEYYLLRHPADLLGF